MSIAFPYRYKQSPIGRIPDPIVTLPLWTWYGWRPFDFLVDSGADMSMVPKSMAELVGIDLSRLPTFRSYGVEGRGLRVYQGQIKFQLGGIAMDTPCLFSSQEKTPLLLGRAGLFQHFSLLFDNRRHHVVFQPL